MDHSQVAEFLGETSPHEIWEYIRLMEFYELVWI